MRSRTCSSGVGRTGGGTLSDVVGRSISGNKGTVVKVSCRVVALDESVVNMSMGNASIIIGGGKGRRRSVCMWHEQGLAGSGQSKGEMRGIAARGEN